MRKQRQRCVREDGSDLSAEEIVGACKGGKAATRWVESGNVSGKEATFVEESNNISRERK